MGAVLYKIFKIVESEGGVTARLKFAQTTKISLKRVKKIKDKPEYIRKFSKLAGKILGKNIDDLLPLNSIPTTKLDTKPVAKSTKKPAAKPVKKEKKKKPPVDGPSKEDDDILL
jgi:hypothetical protein